MGELAAGNFGRSLSALAGSTSAKSSAELALDEVTRREREAKENLDQKLTEKREIERTLNDAPKTPESAATRDALRKELEDKSSQITRAREEKSNAEDQLKRTLKAMTETSAQTSATAAGAIPRSAPEAAAAIAGDLVQLQANYLNDHNVDAVKIACITSLGKEPLPDPNQPNVTHRGTHEQYRYNYQRALSVWCDELVESMKRNEAVLMKIQAERGQPPTRSTLMELVVPGAHAVGPLGAPLNAEPKASK